MPYSIKILVDIKKDGRTEALLFYALSDLMYDPVRLMNGCMTGSKAKLVVRKERREVNHFGVVAAKVFENPRGQWKKANRSIGSDIIDRFNMFW
jgi:hypothetical protein